MDNAYAYIKEASRRSRGFHIHKSIPVLIKDAPISEEVDIEEFVEEVEKRIPRALLQNVEMIYIGEFPHLEDRNALYSDGGIYITNREPTTHDMLEDIIHEIAHAVEIGRDIYSVNLRNEFLGKRERLKSILESEGYELPEKYYHDIEYNTVFDKFLSDVVGYPALLNLTMGLFVSPYGATSINEYFANGFEKYYLGMARDVKKTSPVLYEILSAIYRESDDI
jgi:hypothetical protein